MIWLDKPRCIIPCSGYGTRMGMKSNESKEMLSYEGQPIIDYSIDLCKEYNMEPLFVVRKEKEDLISYLKEINAGDMLILNAPTKEWPDTILQSKQYWHFANVLMLPDTRFNSSNVLDAMTMNLNSQSDLSIAIHKLDKPEEHDKWCVVDKDFIWEKPKLEELAGKMNVKYAMGLIGWRYAYGEELFKALLERKPYYLGQVKTSFVYLDEFQDITRGEK